jgi:hypothetical protein
MILLTRLERRWAHAILDTLFPGPDRGALPAGILDMDVDGFLDETFQRVPFEASLGLRAAFWIIGLAPLFMIGKLATIASLEPKDRLRVLLAMNASPVYLLRGLVMMVKAIGALFFCGDARVRPTIVGVVPAVAPDVVPVRLRSGARGDSAPPTSAPPSSSPPSSSSASSSPGADHEHRPTV